MRSRAFSRPWRLPSRATRFWVAAGTYTPTTGTDRTVSFVLKSGVAVYGGFPDGGGTFAQRDWNANPTILSGDIGTPNDNSDNSYHVVVAIGTDATAVLDGFTITGGEANGISYPSYYGGGIYSDFGNPTIRNCTLRENSAQYGGGGMYDFSSSPQLTNCTFSGNTAASGGECGTTGTHRRAWPTARSAGTRLNRATAAGCVISALPVARR